MATAEQERSGVRGPFVRTPDGEAVVEIVERDEFYVRFKDGTREWLDAAVCEQIETPADYEPSALRDIPGCPV
jgi:hypothetical protein